METMGTTGNGLYRRLWAVRARSNQRRALTGSWAMLPTTGFIQIEQGGETYGTIDHGNLRGKTPSLLALPAMLYRRLWAVRVCSARWRVLIRSWATPPMTIDIQIERGGDFIQYNQPWIFEQLGGGAAAAAVRQRQHGGTQRGGGGSLVVAWRRRQLDGGTVAAAACRRQQRGGGSLGAAGRQRQRGGGGHRCHRCRCNRIHCILCRRPHLAAAFTAVVDAAVTAAAIASPTQFPSSQPSWAFTIAAATAVIVAVAVKFTAAIAAAIALASAVTIAAASTDVSAAVILVVVIVVIVVCLCPHRSIHRRHRPSLRSRRRHCLHCRCRPLCFSALLPACPSFG